jgi:hypothetical protein
MYLTNKKTKQHRAKKPHKISDFELNFIAACKNIKNTLLIYEYPTSKKPIENCLNYLLITKRQIPSTVPKVKHLIVALYIKSQQIIT